MASLFVDDTVLSATVVIFSRKGCPYSWRARLLLEEIDMEPKMVELETLGDFGEEVERILRRITGQVSVPYIFAQGQCIGTIDKIIDQIATGRLYSMLKK